MSEWNASQYLKFQSERTQPATDLICRIPLAEPKEIIDIGCGPGNSTEALWLRWQTAHIVGIDSSAPMIERARASYPALTFVLCDANRVSDVFPKPFDLVFSNACLQWIPEHERLLPSLFSLVKRGGYLAVQIPKNENSPLHRTIAEVTAAPKWGLLQTKREQNGSLPAEAYFDLLTALTDNVSLWETEYIHRMESYDAMLEWVKGTRLRPYLSALDAERQEELQSEIRERLVSFYPVQRNGEILLRFKRLFFLAGK